MVRCFMSIGVARCCGEPSECDGAAVRCRTMSVCSGAHGPINEKTMGGRPIYCCSADMLLPPIDRQPHPAGPASLAACGIQGPNRPWHAWCVARTSRMTDHIVPWLNWCPNGMSNTPTMGALYLVERAHVAFDTGPTCNVGSMGEYATDLDIDRKRPADAHVRSP